MPGRHRALQALKRRSMLVVSIRYLTKEIKLFSYLLSNVKEENNFFLLNILQWL